LAISNFLLYSNNINLHPFLAEVTLSTTFSWWCYKLYAFKMLQTLWFITRPNPPWLCSTQVRGFIFSKVIFLFRLRSFANLSLKPSPKLCTVNSTMHYESSVSHIIAMIFSLLQPLPIWDFFLSSHLLLAALSFSHCCCTWIFHSSKP